MAFTDAQAAQRLLDRLSRSVAAHMDAENLHSAERMMNVSARRYLQEVIALDTPPTDTPIEGE